MLTGMTTSIDICLLTFGVERTTTRTRQSTLVLDGIAMLPNHSIQEEGDYPCSYHRKVLDTASILVEHDNGQGEGLPTLEADDDSHNCRSHSLCRYIQNRTRARARTDPKEYWDSLIQPRKASNKRLKPSISACNIPGNIDTGILPQ